MKPAGRHIAPFLLAVLSACSFATVSVLSLEPGTRDPTARGSVQLLAAEPTRPYDAIALISVSSGLLDEEYLKKQLLDAAARLGGHAAIVDAHSLSRNGDLLVLSAKVVAFRDSSAVARAGAGL